MKEKIFFLLLLSLIFSLSLRGMEIERPVLGLAITAEARARDRGATEENEGDEGDDVGQESLSAQQPRGSMSDGFVIKETPETTSSVLMRPDEAVAYPVEVAIRTKVAEKTSQLRAVIEEEREGNLEYIQNFKKAVVPLEQIEPFLNHFIEDSLLTGDEYDWGECIMRSDDFFEMSQRIQQKSEMIAHYRADILTYSGRKRCNFDVVINSQGAIKCAQGIIDCTLRQSELLSPASARNEHLSNALELFLCAEELHIAAVDRALCKARKRKKKSSSVYPETTGGVSSSLAALKAAAEEYYTAAQEAMKTDEAIAKITPFDSNENLTKKHMEKFDRHQKNAELFLESVRYADQATESEKAKTKLAKIQSELASAFHELASYRQECFLSQEIQGNRSMSVGEHESDAEKEQTLVDPHEEELVQQINKLQQQEKLELEKKAATCGVCTIM